MGPRPFGRGEAIERGQLICETLRFNGAATFRPRRAKRAAPYNIPARCFNGAATFRPRRDMPYHTLSMGGGVLQWGRDLSAAESVRVGSFVPELTSFNGAATFRPRRAS